MLLELGTCPAFPSLVARALLHVQLQVGLESVPFEPQCSMKWRWLSCGFQVTVVPNLLMYTQSRGRAFLKHQQHQVGLVVGKRLCSCASLYHRQQQAGLVVEWLEEDCSCASPFPVSLFRELALKACKHGDT